MIFDLEKLSEYDPQSLRVNFDTLVLVDIDTFGFIEEKKLHTPCKGTKMSVEQIFRYQEQGYVIKYNDDYLEDMYFLASYYNAKIELEHQENRSLKFQPLIETMKILRKRLSKNPKFKKILGEIKIANNPFNDAMVNREIEKNLNTTAKLELLKAEYRDDHLLENEKLTYDDMIFVEEELNSYYKEFRELNKYNRDIRTDIAPKGILNKYRKEEKEKLKTYEI